MKKLLFALLLLCLFCTCKKDPYANLCGGRDPIKNLPWLKAKIDMLKANNSHSGITRVNYKGQTIYFLGFFCCDTCSCAAATPYDCVGNIIKLTSEQYYDIGMNNEIYKPQVIWSN